jgi:hypothetical protein
MDMDMDIDSIVSLVTGIYETNPYIALAGLAVILAISYYKPMIVAKSLLGIGFIVGAALAFQSLSGTLDSGIEGRDTMLEEKKGN